MLRFLTVLIAVLSLSSSASSELMTPELLWKLGRVGSPEVSPDGKWLVYTVTRYDLEKNKGNSDLWLLPVAGGEARRLTTHAKSDSGARWSPEGKRIGFISARGDKRQVYAISPFGGEAVRLTEVEEGVANFDWSPRGDRISFTSEVRVDPELKTIYPDLPEAKARIIDDLLYRHWDHWYEGKYSHLFVMDVDGGEPRDLMDRERVHTPLVPFGGRGEIAWSPDGAELCYTAKRVENPESSTDSDLYLVPADGGEHVCITDGMDGFDRNPLYSPDGRWIAFHSMERAGFEADRERLMLYDREQGTVRDLTDNYAHWVGDTAWAADSSGLFFSSPVEGTRQLFRIDLDGNVSRLTEGRHDLNGVAVAGDQLIAKRQSFERPYELVRLPAPPATRPRVFVEAEPRRLRASCRFTAARTQWVLTSVAKTAGFSAILPTSLPSMSSTATLLMIPCSRYGSQIALCVAPRPNRARGATSSPAPWGSWRSPGSRCCAGDAPFHDQDVLLGVGAYDREVLNGGSGAAVTAGVHLALEDVGRGGRSAGRTGAAVVVRTVGGGAAVGVVAAYGSAEPAPFAGAGDIDAVARLEEVYAEVLSHLVAVGVVYADLADESHGAGARLLEVSQHRSRDVLLAPSVEADLQGAVAVFLDAALLEDRTGTGENEGHGYGRTVLVVDLGHPEFLAEQSYRHDWYSSHALPVALLRLAPGHVR